MKQQNHRLSSIILLWSILILSCLSATATIVEPRVHIVVNGNQSPRYRFATTKLVNALKSHGYKITIGRRYFGEGVALYLGINKDTAASFAAFQKNKLYGFPRKKEGFMIRTVDSKTLLLFGYDATGVLYGVQELERMMHIYGKLPEYADQHDAPQMVLRGACIGLQKPYYLPGRTVYEYPYTEESFPWFYDKQLWIKTLDSMMENRMNSLYPLS